MIISYRNENGYLIPILEVPKPLNKPIGIFGSARKSYLKNYHRSIYSAMMIKGTLLEHLAEVDEFCRDEMRNKVETMAKSQGVTEELKKKDSYQWAKLMNNIQETVRESVLKEFVYTEEDAI